MKTPKTLSPLERALVNELRQEQQREYFRVLDAILEGHETKLIQRGAKRIKGEPK